MNHETNPSARPPSKCRLILNADDFGWSEGANAAICELYDRGIVTSASLMVAGPAARDAVARLADRPGLAVGLHLALVHCPPLLPPDQVRPLLDRRGRLPENTTLAGLRHLLFPSCRAAARREMEAQFKAFAALGIPWSHLDFHVHYSLTPGVLEAALAAARAYPVVGLRIPEDDFGLFRRLCPAEAGGQRWLAAWFSHRCAAQRRLLARGGYRTTQRCFGFFRSGNLDADYLCRLVRALPDGDFELHCHPDFSTTSGRQEFAALTTPAFRAALEKRGVFLTTYQKLTAID